MGNGLREGLGCGRLLRTWWLRKSPSRAWLRNCWRDAGGCSAGRLRGTVLLPAAWLAVRLLVVGPGGVLLGVGLRGSVHGGWGEDLHVRHRVRDRSGVDVRI